MRRRLFWFGIVLSFLFTTGAPALAAAPEVEVVAKQLVCQCGCLSILNNCVHKECASRDLMLGMVEQRVADGMTSEQVVQSFVKQYGERVLAEPPKKGFNLTAWLFPFVALIVGIGMVALALRRWVPKQRSALKESFDGDDPDKSYDERLERELKKFQDWGFR